MTESPVLRLSGAAFTHPGGSGVSGLDLDIAPGEAVALIGPNGAGKSTLLNGVLGLVPLTAGTMQLAGDDEHARNGMIGFLPQSTELDGDFPISLEQVVMQDEEPRQPEPADERELVAQAPRRPLAQRMPDMEADGPGEWLPVSGNTGPVRFPLRFRAAASG